MRGGMTLLRAGLGLLLLLLFIWAIHALEHYQQQLDGAVVSPPGAAASSAVPDDPDWHHPDPWLGKTGLKASAEAQLMRFVHMKLGEQDDDPEAVQPEDMIYLGVFDQDEGRVRYWLLPPQGHGELYVTVTGDGSADVNYGIASTPPEPAADADSNQGTPMEPDDEDAPEDGDTTDSNPFSR